MLSLNDLYLSHIRLIIVLRVEKCISNWAGPSRRAQAYPKAYSRGREQPWRRGRSRLVVQASGVFLRFGFDS